MQRRGLSSFSLLRSDGVGNHDAKTRKKILCWLSEKRPQKAWLSPPDVTHQNNSTRCSLRSRQIFRHFFEYAAAVPRNGGHIYWEWPAKCIGSSSVELREFRAQQKSCGRELFMTACDSCFFAKRENNLLERHRWQFLTSDPCSKEYMSLQCQGYHEHVWKQTSEGKREYPSAMIRRLVNGFVHDLRPPQIHMFLSEADHIFSSSPAVFCCIICSTSDAQNAQQVSLATPPKLWQAVKVDIFELEDSQRKGFFALYLQTVVVFMLSGRKSSSAFRAERCDSHFTSGQGLDAALSAVSVFDFGPWCMFRQ